MKTKKTDSQTETQKKSFGTCQYLRTLPDRTSLSPSTQILNVQLTLAEAMKLQLALDECTRKIFRYKQSTKIAKEAVVTLGVHLQLSRVSVMEGKCPSAQCAS
jgi:Glu-tRNA(Gln) amidotransferase subunit E-like FAD-binding protein